MRPTNLINQLAAQLEDHIQEQGLPVGHRFTERALAEQFKVSRSPVRVALAVLEQKGVLTPAERGGYVVADYAPDATPVEETAPNEDEQVYLLIADDRFTGALPERITENELMRRYGLSRGRLSRLLRRMANERWIERLPGNGWEFLPVLTSLQAYEDSYRFRLLIEPAAILEPNFSLNRPALEKCREQQQWLVDGGIWDVSGPKLFELNSGMHEAIIECSNNSFFIDALKRIDLLRRLIDYRQMLDRDMALVRCKEHVYLLDLLLADRRQEASDFMRQHLEELVVLKTMVREARPNAEAAE